MAEFTLVKLQAYGLKTDSTLNRLYRKFFPEQIWNMLAVLN